VVLQVNDIVDEILEQRLGRLHARQRLGIERDHEAQFFGQGLNYVHLENSRSAQFIIRNCLKLTGLYQRGCRNAAEIEIRHNDLRVAGIPDAFDEFTILQLSDLHVDMNAKAMERLAIILPELRYDFCVLTGDYRGETFGPFEAAMAGMARLRPLLKGPVYGVLGNHDTILMVPGLEDLGIRMLLNECVTIERAAQRIHLAGIDDAHFYRVDNIEKAAAAIPHGEFSILLSHTPEIYRHAAHAGFNVLLSGHTHGGQICLPGGVPLMLESTLPRRMGSGAWTYHQMAGYTSVGAGASVVPVRFNCPPEITLHHVRTR